MERERVEPAYELTAEDFREAFAAQARHTVVGRLTRVVPWAIVGFSALGSALKAADGQVGGADAVLPAALVAPALFLPRWRVASASRRAAERGERRAVAAEAVEVFWRAYGNWPFGHGRRPGRPLRRAEVPLGVGDQRAQQRPAGRVGQRRGAAQQRAGLVGEGPGEAGAAGG